MRFEQNLNELRELSKWISGDIPMKENSKNKHPKSGASVFQEHPGGQ